MPKNKKPVKSARSAKRAGATRISKSDANRVAGGQQINTVRPGTRP